MKSPDIEKLLERYNSGLASPEESALVETWYLKLPITTRPPSEKQLIADQKESLSKLLDQIKKKNKEPNWLSFAIAASILIFLGAGMYLFTSNKIRKIQQFTVNRPLKNDAAPGGNRAILTLSNGKKIVLTGVKNGVIANQGSVLINKTADGKIDYADSKSEDSSGSLLYNVASTPRGGQYQLTLSDGTKVWLNSASSIKYPVAFKGNNREVELTGEGYFEVTHNEKKPFIVIAGGQSVKVLGTHFNINAYGDELAVKTTLLEGSVNVSSKSASYTIKPGEQAQLINGSISISNVDVEKAIAWKNGLFYFEDNNIEEVMRQLSRWYDVDIKYEGQLPPRQFSGEISRNVNVSQILDILSFKKIHYKIEGKSIVVMP